MKIPSKQCNIIQYNRNTAPNTNTPQMVTLELPNIGQGTAVEARSCVNTLREATLCNDQHSTHVLAARFRQRAEQLQEACKLLQHVATTDTLEMNGEHVTRTLYTLAPQVCSDVWAYCLAIMCMGK